MTARLQTLSQQCCKGAVSWRAQLTEQLQQMIALARFLSYVAFGFAEGAAGWKMTP